MSKKVKLIFNPIANLGRAWNVAAALKPIVEEYGGADWAGTVYPGHATELACQAGLDGYEKVVALGGDGTVHEVVNGLMQVPEEKRPAMGIVPVGSGNDFAYCMGVSTHTEKALRQAFTGEACPIDIGQLDDMNGRIEYFSNTVGLGFDSIVTIRSRRIPIVHGFAIYFVAVLQTIILNFNPYNLKITADGEAWEETDLMVVVCNGRREGGGFQIDPAAMPDDGILNFVSVKGISRPKMLYTLPFFLNGTHQKLNYVHMKKIRQIEIKSQQPLVIHTDGEIFSGLNSQVRHVTMKVFPSSLKVICCKPEA
jgi:diacylglycerol kinase (ATP)